MYRKAFSTECNKPNVDKMNCKLITEVYIALFAVAGASSRSVSVSVAHPSLLHASLQTP